MLYGGNIFRFRDYHTLTQFTQTVLQPRLDAVKRIEIEPRVVFRWTCDLSLEPALLEKLTNLREICFIQPPGALVSNEMQALASQKHKTDITARQSERYNEVFCCLGPPRQS